MTDVNFWSVGAATIASFIFGALWYSPLLFLKPWSRESGVDPSTSIANPARVYGLTFFLTLVSALALAIMLGPEATLSTGLGAGACVGAFVVATSMGINYQFANRGLLFWSIDVGFHFCRFSLMGVVLGSWP